LNSVGTVKTIGSWGVAQAQGPEFKPQYHKKKKEHGGEMTQTLYAHKNKRNFLKRKQISKKKKKKSMGTLGDGLNTFCIMR
jgi:hypothetical protein